jgi:hypothetical protein
MAENEAAEPQQTAAEPTGQRDAEAKPEQVPQGAPEPRQRTDWKAESRKWEERAKRSETALRDLKAANERAAAVSAVAKKAGVPVEVLARMEGDPEENAAILASALAPARGYKVTRDAGEKPAAKADPMREAARALFGTGN